MDENIKIWKESGAKYCTITFSCGGDSMNDIEAQSFDENDEPIATGLEDYFIDESYNRVEYYVNSDGHYMGESGTVLVILEDGAFTYSKDSEAEYSEISEVEIYVPLDEEQVALIKAKVSNVNGGEGTVGFNFNGDHILTDEEDVLIEETGRNIDNFVCEYPYEVEGEMEDWYGFNSGTELEWVDNALKIDATVSHRFYRRADW